ncbi:MAG: porin [Myxococcales bacterium]|nr:porin [Myxococcales bacterium]
MSTARWLALATLCAASPAAAADGDALRPVQVAGDHLTLGGYFQPGYVAVKDTPFDNDDADGFQFGNARLTARGRLQATKQLEAGLRFDVEAGQGALQVRDLRGTLAWFDGALAVDVGQFKVPFLLAELTSESRLQFAAPTDVDRLSYGRDRGLQVRAARTLGGVHLGAQLGVFNGEGQNVSGNPDDDYTYAGRVEVHPLGEVSEGEPDLDGSPLRVAVGGSFLYSPTVARKDLSLGDAGAEEWRAAGELRLKWRGLSVRGEFVTAQLSGDSAAQEYGRRAFYAQAGYVLPLDFVPKLELVARFARYDLNDEEDGYVPVGDRLQFEVQDNAETQQVDVGLNAYVVGHRLKVMLMYRLTDFQEGAEVDEDRDVLIGDTFYAFLQLGWL